MRGSLTRFAKQASEKYLTPGNPTGITGISTHPAPRPALINLYSDTLASLKKLPASSAYRASAEALTKHRLSIVTAVKPDGHDAWLQRVRSAHPDRVQAAEKEGRAFAVNAVIGEDVDERYVSWNGEGEEPVITPDGKVNWKLLHKGTNRAHVRKYEEVAAEVRKRSAAGVAEEELLSYAQSELKGIEEEQERKRKEEAVMVELEPALTAEQVSEIEQKIGAGLIEEVIEVAQGELKLIDVLSEHKVWEELDEKTPEGQWSYFERSARHTAAEGGR